MSSKPTTAEKREYCVVFGCSYLPRLLAQIIALAWTGVRPTNFHKPDLRA